ncbi:MAG: alpha/beta hydrolase [Alphaproteobacteria bacterium]|nr:alpha/beta hydrolase [Alphaproteobacteria bacterium]
MFAGFVREDVEGDGTRIHLVRAGSGPGLLLLHGFPQTHAMWHRIAPALAERFTVVATDLRGYGDSGKPRAAADHAAHAKRATANDQVAVMAGLGFEQFCVAGHDRGARVAHRMALDHPARVRRLAILDILPTPFMYANLTQELAMAFYHLFLFAQPNLPERLIGADPDAFLDHHMGRFEGGMPPFAPAAMAEYRRCFRDAPTREAMFEDYRAAASIDLDHHRADQGQKIACPTLVLWGARGLIHRHHDVLAVWRDHASDVCGRALPCGHYLAEEQPEATLDELLRFFGS